MRSHLIELGALFAIFALGWYISGYMVAAPEHKQCGAFCG